jgi:hypothetical protein
VDEWRARGEDGRELVVRVVPKNEGAFRLGGRRYEVVASLEGGRSEVVADEVGEEAARRAAVNWMRGAAP